MYDLSQAQEPYPFEGFDKTLRIVSEHLRRVQVYEQFELTTFIADERVVVVHIDNTTHADRVHLSAFDKDGIQVGSDIVYLDEPGQRFDLIPEFNGAGTGRSFPRGTALELLVVQETGWVADMDKVRAYDLNADRAKTQRTSFLENLKDMIRTGKVRSFGIDGPTDLDEI